MRTENYVAPSIYDWRENEYEVAEKIKRENRREVIEMILFIPLAIITFVLMLFA